MLAQSHILNNIAAIWEEITHFVTGGSLNEMETGSALIDGGLRLSPFAEFVPVDGFQICLSRLYTLEVRFEENT